MPTNYIRMSALYYHGLSIELYSDDTEGETSYYVDVNGRTAYKSPDARATMTYWSLCARIVLALSP